MTPRIGRALGGNLDVAPLTESATPLPADLTLFTPP